MKMKIMGLVFVLSLWVFLNFREEISVSEAPIKTQVQSKDIQPQKKLIKISTHAPEVKELNEAQEESNKDNSDYPWHELESKWEDEIKNEIQNLNPENATKIFSAYKKSKEDFEKQTNLIANKMASTYKYDEQNDKIIFINKKQYEKYNEQLNTERKFYLNKNKTIFGSHYNEIQRAYHEFLKPAQAYYSGEGQIGIDPAFSE